MVKGTWRDIDLRYQTCDLISGIDREWRLRIALNL
jgi:hypothetical protein